jgi:uncharacterized membrane protein required for colicin V production
MSLSPVDLALLCGVALLVGIGLYRGLSGELASFAGFVAAVAAGYSLYDFAHVAVRSFGFDKGDTTELVVTGVAVFVLGLVAFGLVRWVVDKFVSFLVPQPTNALLGAVSGLFKSLVVLSLLVGVGFVRPGTYAQGWLAQRSQVACTLAEWADSFCADRLGADGQEGENAQKEGNDQRGGFRGMANE